MAVPGIPNNFTVQTGNFQNYVSADLTSGALSYSIQRSIDGINFTVVATPATPSYLDTAVTVGTQYYYQMAGVNVSGTGIYSTALSVVTTPTAEMSLGQLRLSAQQRADRVGSNFVTNVEWNSYINQSIYALYDILVTSYEDYFMAPRARFTTDGTTFRYPLPNGVLSFTDQNNAPFIAAPFYKLLGVDLSVYTNNNSFVTIDRYNFIDRNNYIYPNSGSAGYGVFNSRYRLMGNSIEFIPTPSANQVIQLLYIPRLPQLLQDTDITTIGYSGWLEYVILRAAILALTKEESDISVLALQLQDVQARIQSSAVNKDVGQPDTISNTRGTSSFGSGGGWNGSIGGF